MSFTEQDLLAQIAMFEELKEEFSRLQMKEQALKKQLNISDADLKLDMSKLTPEEKNMLAYAENEAKKMGSERASQHSNSRVAKPSAGTSRKNAIRL